MISKIILKGRSRLRRVGEVKKERGSREDKMSRGAEDIDHRLIAIQRWTQGQRRAFIDLEGYVKREED
jgi:hypothetical protein